MHYYLYEIRNNLNGKIYVGVHKAKSLDDGYMGSGKIIRRAIMKHGISNFSKVILETFENAEAMYAREKEVVSKEFLEREDVYNLRRGGFGGFEYINKNNLGVVHKFTAAESMLGNKILSARSKDYFSERNKKSRLKIPAEVRQKIAIAASKLANTPEANAKRKATRELTAFQKGANNSQYGVKRHSINKNGIRKRILYDELDHYISDGWAIGWPPKT